MSVADVYYSIRETVKEFVDEEKYKNKLHSLYEKFLKFAKSKEVMDSEFVKRVFSKVMEEYETDSVDQHSLDLQLENEALRETLNERNKLNI